MKNRIVKVKLYVNHTSKAESVAKKAREVLLENRFQIVEEGYELAIAIGGDGSFLRMIKENNFNSDIYYVGINAGTLGFLQEIRPEQIYEFVSKLRNKKVKIEEVSVQETMIYFQDKIETKFSLNEILVREKNLNVAKLSVCIDEDLLEHFTGDGLLITTSIGSTAYNLSFGGSIVYSDLHTLQITPVAPLNSNAYRNLLNPVVIPENKKITIYPINEEKNLFLYIDGDNYIYENVSKVETFVREKKIKCIRLNNYSYTEIIHEKFLK